MYKYQSTIASKKLNIDQLKNHFKAKTSFETKDIFSFYKKLDATINATAVNWRVHKLIQLGILSRIGRGKFTIGESKNFIPEISLKIKSIYSKLKKEFPFTNISIWNTSSINEFMVHQPGRFFILIEVEKDARSGIFYFLKEAKLDVFIDPTSDLIEKYMRNGQESIIIKSLVSEAPIQQVKGISTITIEKMLVDIFCDDIIFSSQQGAEMRTIFNEALNKYSVNENKMLRYAARRRKKDELTKYLSSLSNWRHKVHT